MFSQENSIYYRSYYKQELDSWKGRKKTPKPQNQNHQKTPQNKKPPQNHNKTNKTKPKPNILYLLRVHVEFLPSHGYLLISLSSFATHGEKEETISSYQLLFYKNDNFWVSLFESYFGYFVFSITKRRHSLFIKQKIMLLFSIPSSNCKFRELYDYQSETFHVLSNIFSIQMNGTPEQDKVRL